MKIIDLLNKITNGEEVPKKIKIFNHIFIYTGDKRPQRFYRMLNQENYLLRDFVYTLDKEVEILEEEKKMPEKLNDILRVDDLIPPVDENMYKIWTQTIKNQNKINSIIDYLKSKGK